MDVQIYPFVIEIELFTQISAGHSHLLDMECTKLYISTISTNIPTILLTQLSWFTSTFSKMCLKSRSEILSFSRVFLMLYPAPCRSSTISFIIGNGNNAMIINTSLIPRTPPTPRDPLPFPFPTVHQASGSPTCSCHFRPQQL